MGRSKKKKAEKAHVDDYVRTVSERLARDMLKIVAENRCPRDRLFDVYAAIALKAFEDEDVMVVAHYWANPPDERIPERPKAWIRWPWETGAAVPTGRQFDDWIAESVEILDIREGR